MTKQIETRVIHVRAEKSYTRKADARKAAFKAMESGQDWIAGWTGDIQEHEGRFFPVLERVEKIEVEIETSEEKPKRQHKRINSDLLWKSKSGRVLAGQSGSVAESVWMMCYMITAHEGSIPKARRVVLAGAEAGFATGTVKNAYGLWKRTVMTNGMTNGACA